MPPRLHQDLAFNTVHCGVLQYVMIQMQATKFLPEMAFSNQEVEAERVPAFVHYTQKATLNKLSKTIHYAIIMVIS